MPTESALQSGNQLASIQIQEARKMRELMATNAQSALVSQMKAEKESQMQKRMVEDFNKY